MKRSNDQPNQHQSLADMVNPKTGNEEPTVISPQQQASTLSAPGPMSTVTPQQPQTVVPKRGFPKKILLVIAAFIFAGGGAAAFLATSQKSPEQIWSSALSNTADGLDSFIELGTQEQKGFKLDGEFSIKKPIIVDGSSSGQFDPATNSGELKFDIGATGLRIDAEVIADGSADSSPDIYFKVGGLEGVGPLLTTFGDEDILEIASFIGQLNDQWYVVDHTLIDEALAGAEAGLDASRVTLSEADVRVVAEKISAVMRERFFSSDSATAVFTLQEELGEEDFEGISSYKFKVGVDKQNLKDFATALKDALKDTKLEDLLLEGQSEASLEDVLQFDDLLNSIDSFSTEDSYAHVWVQADGGFVRNIRLFPVEDKADSNYLDFLLNYEGGDVFPFLIRATIDDGGASGLFSLGMDVNQKNGDTKFTMDLDLTNSGEEIEAAAELTVTGMDDGFSVSPPSDAKSFIDLVSTLSGGSPLNLLPTAPLTQPQDFNFTIPGEVEL